MAAFCGAALWMTDSLVRRSIAMPENSLRILTVPLPAANDVMFYERAIVVAGAGGLTVLSAKCPHLGCRINGTEGGDLVCPCHASRFRLNGELLHGPARRGLTPLPFAVDAAAGVVHITLKNEVA